LPGGHRRHVGRLSTLIRDELFRFAGVIRGRRVRPPIKLSSSIAKPLAQGSAGGAVGVATAAGILFGSTSILMRPRRGRDGPTAIA
jgi:hypothetical protein